MAILTDHERRIVRESVRDLRRIEQGSVPGKDYSEEIDDILSRVSSKIIKKLKPKCNWRVELECAKLRMF